MISDWRTQLTTLENECAEVEAQIASQIANLRNLLQTKRAQMAQLPPIQSLSDDIIYLIFEEAYLHDFPRCRLHSGELQYSPVVVTHVCRRWRRLALELPALWSCVHITPYPVQKGAGHLEALDAFLKRSRNRDLSILFIAYLPYHDYKMEGMPEGGVGDYRTHWPHFLSCLKRLLQHSGRWRYCGFYFGNANQLKSVYKALRTLDFPSLQFLQMLVHHEADASMERFTLSIKAPNLQEFRGSVAYTTGPSIYAGLTNLMLDNHRLSSRRLIRVLKNLSSTLERLTLRLISIYGDSPSSSLTPLSLPRLRDLTIAEHQNVDEAGIQTTRELLCSCPNLEMFHSVNLNSFDTIVRPDLPIRFDRVRSLFMQHSDWVDRNGQRWHRHISMFHKVQDAHIYDTFAMTCLTEIRYATVDTHAAWPDLQTLSISVRSQSDLDNVLAFLKHRADIQHPVSSITFLCSAAHLTELQQHWETEGHGAVAVDWKCVFSANDPFDPWDDYYEAPSLKPWKGSLTLEDQDF